MTSRQRTPKGRGLTNDAQVCKDGEISPPARRRHRPPQPIMRPWKLRDPTQYRMTQDIDRPHKSRARSRQTLDEDVRDVKVGRLGQVLGENILGLHGLLEDLDDDARGGGCERRDEEYLDDLEGEVGCLREKLDHVDRGNAGSGSEAWIRVSTGGWL